MLRLLAHRRRALEVALATVTNTLDAEAFDLEKHAFPAVGTCGCKLVG